jgi:hypothetical protein
VATAFTLEFSNVSYGGSNLANLQQLVRVLEGGLGFMLAALALSIPRVARNAEVFTLKAIVFLVSFGSLLAVTLAPFNSTSGGWNQAAQYVFQPLAQGALFAIPAIL